MSDSTIIRELVNEDGSCTITDHGAHLLDWTPIGHLPILWTPLKLSITPGEPIRGGVPIMTPWFASGFRNGKPAQYQPFHSFARRLPWHARATDSPTHLSYEIDATSMPQDALRASLLTEESRDDDVRFHIQYKIDFGDDLELKLTFSNDSDVPITVDMGFHNYLRVGDLTKVTLRGLENVPFFDALTGIAQPPSENPLLPIGPIDSVYEKTKPVTIHDPVFRRNITVTPMDASRIIVWTPWADGDKAADIGQGQWRHFICVESTICREGQAILQPGEQRSLQQTISVEKQD